VDLERERGHSVKNYQKSLVHYIYQVLFSTSLSLSSSSSSSSSLLLFFSYYYYYYYYYYLYWYYLAGELLRQERLSGSDDGKIIDKIINDGKIVPVAITIKLIKDAILKSNNDLFLIDGFPRNQDNLSGWEENMTNICDVEATIFIDCPEEELQKRLLSRGIL